jgi:hypothetical protein
LSSLLSAIAPNIVALGATVIGLLVFFAPPGWNLALGLLAVFGVLMPALATRESFQTLRVARAVLEFAAVAPLALAAAGVTLALHLTLDAHLDGLIPSTRVPAGKLDGVTGVLIGAVSTFFSATATSFADKVAVGALFKALVGQFAKEAGLKPTTVPLNDALNHETVEGETASGWGFAGRSMRVRIILRELGLP